MNGDHQWNAGNANSNLQYLDGILQLNYTDGQKCHHNDLARNTVISFVCGASDVENGEPVFIGETDDCTYYISWHTELACEEHVSIFYDDESGNKQILHLLAYGTGVGK